MPIALRDRVRALERRWARLGRPRPPTQGLREHLETLPLDLVNREEREASARLVGVYYAVRYGGTPLTDEMLRDLGAAPPADGS